MHRIQSKPPALDWEDATFENGKSGQVAEIVKGKYRIRLEKHYDDLPDLFFLGEYTDQAAPGVIDRKARHDWSPRQYRYWQPATPLAEQRQYFHRFGYAKGDTWLKAKQSIEDAYRRHESYNRGDWCMIGIVATVYVGEVICSSGSCWGIESDALDHHNEVAADLIEDILGEAEKNMKALIRQKALEIAALAE